MSEKNDYQIFKRNVQRGHDRMERIENSAGAGQPDVNFCSEGVECWIELKSPTEPKRASSKLFAGKNHKLLQTQKNWFLKQKNAGGKGYILIATDKRWMLIDGCKYGDEVNGMTVIQLLRISSWSTSRNLSNWNRLHMILGGQIDEEEIELSRKAV